MDERLSAETAASRFIVLTCASPKVDAVHRGSPRLKLHDVSKWATQVAHRKPPRKSVGITVETSWTTSLSLEETTATF